MSRRIMNSKPKDSTFSKNGSKSKASVDLSLPISETQFSKDYRLSIPPWKIILAWLGFLVLGLGFWFWAWFNFPMSRLLLIYCAVAIGLIGIYPLSYIAYLSFSSETHRDLLETDFRLLGLVNEEDITEIVKELYLTVYNPLQFLIYISLIIIQSLLIFVGYLNSDRLGVISAETMALIFYSYLGASFFAIQHVVRRYSTFDLQPQVYSVVVVRIFVSTVIVFVGVSIIILGGGQLSAGPPNPIEGAANEPQAWAALLAFVIGVFPDQGVRWFLQLTSRILNTGFDPINQYSLKNIIGINDWHQARLAEIGIDNAQNLATVDIRKLLLTTRFDTQEIIHWIDQAILYVKVGQRIDRFRDAKISTFHEFRFALDEFSISPFDAQDGESTSKNEARKRLATVLGSADPDELDRLSDPSNFPNYAHIAEYYTRMAMVTRQQAASGMEILIGDIKETNFERAIENAKRLLRQNPDDPKVLTSLGVAYYGLAQQDKTDKTERDSAMVEAYNAYTHAIEIDDKIAQAFYSRSMIYMARGEYESAMQDCTQAIEIDGMHAQAFNNRGLAYMHMGYLDRAIADLNKALELNRLLTEAYANRGYAHSEQGNPAMALMDFERADLLGYHKHSLFWFRWGETLWKIGNYTKAIDKLSNAILHDPYFGMAYARRGDAYLQLGKKYHPQARIDLNKAIKNAPSDDESWLASVYSDLGILEAREKRYPQAIGYFKRVFELDADNCLASYNLAKVYKENNQPHEAQRELQHLLQIAPEDSLEVFQGRKWLSDLEISQADVTVDKQTI